MLKTSLDPLFIVCSLYFIVHKWLGQKVVEEKYRHIYVSDICFLILVMFDLG